MFLAHPSIMGCPSFFLQALCGVAKKTRNAIPRTERRRSCHQSPSATACMLHANHRHPLPSWFFLPPPPFSLSSHKLAVWVNLASKVPILLFPAQTIIRPADRPNPWFFDFSPVPSNHTQGFHHWRSWPKLDTPQQQHNPH